MPICHLRTSFSKTILMLWHMPTLTSRYFGISLFWAVEVPSTKAPCFMLVVHLRGTWEQMSAEFLTMPTCLFVTWIFHVLPLDMLTYCCPYPSGVLYGRHCSNRLDGWAWSHQQGCDHERLTTSISWYSHFGRQIDHNTYNFFVLSQQLVAVKSSLNYTRECTSLT